MLKRAYQNAPRWNEWHEADSGFAATSRSCGVRCPLERAKRGGREALTALLTAFSFLSILPGTWRVPSQRQISDSRAYYPLVGLTMGGLLVWLDAGFSRIVPQYLTSAILVVALVVATRGLHLDGLMDLCDGLLGGHNSESRLKIMRDPHVGAFAVAGALCIILLKWTALLSLLSLEDSSNDLPWRGLVILLFPILSRWGMALQLSSFHYARDRGLGSAFHQDGPYLLATLLAATTALAASLVVAGLGGVLLFLVATALAWLMGKGIGALLGGLTGDAYGASNEIIEVVGLVTAVALMPHGLITPLHELLGGS